jgi:Domain of unknown function (DUF4384)
MKRTLISLFIILGLVTGCAYFQKKDEPPPLPAIEETTKPPLQKTWTVNYFKAFPWDALAKPRKDGTDPDVTTYTVEDKEGEALASIAEKTMGDPHLAAGLADYNGISATSKVPVGDKVIIPNPIIGMRNQIIVKSKGEHQFGSPQSFDTQFKKGDQYKFQFESNVDGYCYIFRQGPPKGVQFLYPPALKTKPKKPIKRKGKKGKPPVEEPMRGDSKVKAHEPFEIPIGTKGFTYDAKRAGDVVYVFLSLREIPDLESLKVKTKIRVQDLEEVMRQVNEEQMYSEGPYRLMRIKEPNKILGYKLNLNG